MKQYDQYFSKCNLTLQCIQINYMVRVKWLSNTIKLNVVNRENNCTVGVFFRCFYSMLILNETTHNAWESPASPDCSLKHIPRNNSQYSRWVAGAHYSRKKNWLIKSFGSLAVAFPKHWSPWTLTESQTATSTIGPTHPAAACQACRKCHGCIS